MKTFKVLLAVIVFAGITSSTMAQDPQITAIANVVQEISIDPTTEDNNLIFGQVTAGNNKAVGIDDNVLTGIASGEEQTGWFTLNKAVNTQVDISFDLPDHLTTENDDELSILFDSDEYGQVTDGSTSVSFIPTEGITVSEDNAGDLFAADAFDIRIGGRVEPESDQAQGEYTGTITLEFEYN